MHPLGLCIVCAYIWIAFLACFSFLLVIVVPTRQDMVTTHLLMLASGGVASCMHGETDTQTSRARVDWRTCMAQACIHDGTRTACNPCMLVPVLPMSCPLIQPRGCKGKAVGPCLSATSKLYDSYM